MRPVPELMDDELARLVRARLEGRQPRRLPERFTPPAERSRRVRWAVSAAAGAAVVALALAGTAVARPDLAPAVLSGLLGQRPAATPAPSPSAPGPGQRPAIVPAPAPAPSASAGAPNGGTPGAGAPGAPGQTPAPQPSSGGAPLPVPLPSLPVPLPTPSLPVPLPTPSLPLP